jgi:hypothetical protein
MPAFAAAIDALFADANIATDAVYTPTGDGPINVQVVARRPDEIVGFGDTRIHSATAVFDVRVSDAAAPAEGDTLEIGGETYLVQGEPVLDRERLVWTLDTRPS